MTHDTVIRNGDVVDGSGAGRFRADVAIDGGRIVEVGTVTGRGHREIDADGQVVTPGFIDGHTHMDAQLFWDPLGTSSCWHGVTTVVMGNCGFTLAPVQPDATELVVRNLERAEDIPRESMAEGIKWSWEHFAEYLDVVDALPKGINHAVYVGHSALRTWAMGERAFVEEAGAEDLQRMEQELREALAAGAMGLTTSRSPSHQTADDRPVASRLASWHEVQRLVGVLTDAGHGVVEMALEPASRLSGTPEQAEFLGRLESLALDSGRPITFGLVPCPWQDQINELIQRTNARGGSMVGQTHSRGINLVMSFRTKMPFDKLPAWREVRELPLARQRQLLADPDVRRRLVLAAEHGNLERTTGAEITGPDYASLRAWRSTTGANPLVADMARERDMSPVELIIELGLDSDFEQMFIQPAVEGATEDPDDLAALMVLPNTVMTFSDAGAHVSLISDCSIQTYLLGYWVREREQFALEEAVRMITSAPAAVWSLTDRGLVRPGYVADLNVLDPASIRPELPVVVDDLPGGATRLRQGAVGISTTMVGGDVAIEDGSHTGALPGRLLRGSRSGCQ